MRNRSSASNNKDPLKVAHAQMETALAEFLKAQAMTSREFIDYVRREDPRTPLPPLVDGNAITVKGARALISWASLVRDSDPALKKTCAIDAWKRAVASSFVEAASEARSDTTAEGEATPWFHDRVKDSAARRIAALRGPLTHYVPCYVFRDHSHKSFEIGGVCFYPGDHLASRIEHHSGSRPGWFEDYETLRGAGAASASEHFESNEHRNAGAKRWFPHPLASEVYRSSKAPWVAELCTDGLELGTARSRANDTVRLTLAGLGLLVSPEHCANLHLLDEWTRPAEAGWIAQRGSEDVFAGSRTHRPQVGGAPGWTDRLLEREATYLGWLGTAIGSVMLDHGPAIWPRLRTAWLNALHWYYIGCSESSDARATICFSSALESLSNGDGADRIVDMCECVLGAKRDDVVVTSRELTLKDAVVSFYRTVRSEIVHGGRFVLMQEVTDQRNLGAQFAKLALHVWQKLLADFESAQVGRGELDRKDCFLQWAKARIPQPGPSKV